MWLLPAQVHRILREYGVEEAPAGSPTDVRLTLEVEPAEGMIRISAARVGRSEPSGSGEQTGAGRATVSLPAAAFKEAAAGFLKRVPTRQKDFGAA